MSTKSGKPHLATLRGLGAVGILAWVSPSIQAFFLWQAVVSILTLGIFANLTYASLPPIQRRARFSVQALRGVWRFAGGMVGITFLSLLLTQVDKGLLSKLLSLSDYGYYILATLATSSISIAIAPITQAIYPRLCELNANGNRASLAEMYHKAAQLVSVLAGSAAIVLILLGEIFLQLWTQDSTIAARTAPLISLLMPGSLLNGLMWVPYQAQLAHGWTSLTIKVNIVSVAIIAPANLLVTPRYGAIGAAWVWVSLNLGYAIISSQLMYDHILGTGKVAWYLEDLLLLLRAGFIAGLAVKASLPQTSTMPGKFLLLMTATLATITSSIISAGRIRYRLRQLLAPYNAQQEGIHKSKHRNGDD